MSGGEEYFVQVSVQLIGCGVNEIDQDQGERDVNSGKPKDPTEFLEAHSVQKRQRHESQSHIREAKFLGGFIEINAQLASIKLRARIGSGGLGRRMAAIEKHAREIGGRNTIILAAGNCMFETLRGARICPVHGRIGH